MSTPEAFRSDPEHFDRLYRAEAGLSGGPSPTAIPWDIGRAQPRLMELEALGALTGEILDIGCGLGDNAIYLAARGHSVTALDGSPTAIELASDRADAAGVHVRFGVADATELTGYDGSFDTVVDSALYHCLEDDGRVAYATALHRATRVGARWYLYCFAEGDVNGIPAPRGAVTEENLRHTLSGAGWRITYLGPTTYLGNAAAFDGTMANLPADMVEKMPAEMRERIAKTMARYSAILPFVEGDVHMPFTVVHAVRL